MKIGFVSRIMLIALLYSHGCLEAAPESTKHTPPTPILVPFGDSLHWVLFKELTYIIGDTKEKIIVPRGFVTDLASIPDGLAPFGLKANSQYTRAAIVHDYLYWIQTCTKQQADNIFLIAMKESDVTSWKSLVIHLGVDKFGGFSWESNKKARSAGAIRILPEDKWNWNPNSSWPEYQKTLQQSSVKSIETNRASTYCRLGDTRIVPRAMQGV